MSRVYKISHFIFPKQDFQKFKALNVYIYSEPNDSLSIFFFKKERFQTIRYGPSRKQVIYNDQLYLKYNNNILTEMTIFKKDTFLIDTHIYTSSKLPDFKQTVRCEIEPELEPELKKIS